MRLPVIPIILAVITLFMVFSPALLANIQNESGACGKEFHGTIIPISSLKPDKNIEGSFFLGMGSVHTERVYVAYTGNNNVGYSLIERPISQSLLFEDENNTPYVEQVDIMMCTSYGYEMVTKYKFHVPTGTIKMEYSV